MLDATNIGFALACSVTQAQRGAAVLLIFWRGHNPALAAPGSRTVQIQKTQSIQEGDASSATSA
jgi:hypothetical protein